jgi:hypothetical protein
MYKPNRVLSNDSIWESVVSTGNLPPFSGQLIEFTSNLSTTILQNPKARAFPELIALGFWLRAANINRIISEFLDRKPKDAYYLPRGLSFHVAPANVDTIFVYSWILSLLCGNRNIVRISSRSSKQMQILLEFIDQTLQKDNHSDIASRLAVIRYEASEETTGAICRHTDVRVIWGGDETVHAIRKIPIPPTSIDLSFANKWSLSILDANHWNSISVLDQREVAKKFAVDSFQFGQAACSSPRCLVWLNSESQICDTNAFWEMVENEAQNLFDFSAVDYVNKLVASDLLASEGLTIRAKTTDNRIFRLQVDSNNLNKFIHHEIQCDAGFFLECSVHDLSEVLCQLDRKVQTISSCGISQETWHAQLEAGLIQGIDRIVPFGKSLDFNPKWDGFDLLGSLVRIVTLNIP